MTTKTSYICLDTFIGVFLYQIQVFNAAHKRTVIQPVFILLFPVYANRQTKLYLILLPVPILIEKIDAYTYV